jgi:phytoene dehydrogenase-like protein
MVHVTDEEGGEVALHRELTETAASLERCAPGAGGAWQELMQTLWPHREALVAAGLSAVPPIRASARLLAELRAKALELAPVALASSASLGRHLFGDDRAAAWLAGSGAHADLSPQAPGSGVFALGLNFLGHYVGWPFPQGGAGRLTEALVSRLRALGGRLRCNSPVSRIELAYGRVAGLRLAGGERVDADAVIATTSPRPLLELLPSGAFPTRVERRLSGWRYGMGTVKLDCALSAPIPWRSASARQAAVVHVGGPLAESVRSLTEAGLGGLPARPALVVGQQSLHDRTRAPEGKHTLYAYARVPHRIESGDEELVERIECQIERFAPGLRSLIEHTSLRAPATIEAENPSMANGDLASGSCELDQQLVLRPDPRLCRGRTPSDGLYVAGAWVHPGPGVHGVSGRSAGRAAVRYLRRRRR